VRHADRWDGGPALKARRVGVAGFGILGIWSSVRYGVLLTVAGALASWSAGLRGLERRGRVDGVWVSAAGLAMAEEEVGFSCLWNQGSGH
jgi:hypothetical protein